MSRLTFFVMALAGHVSVLIPTQILNAFVVAVTSCLGMTYVHIPVDFQNPTERDFDAFCTALNKASDSPVHVHCIANYRVSAFFYRYRRTILGMDAARARADLDRVWQPDPVWTEFINRTPAK